MKITLEWKILENDVIDKNVKCQMSIILTKTLMKITLDVCIQIVLKYISTFHTNHKQNLNDTCLNYDSYEIKLLENINDDIIDKNVNDIWFLKEKKDNIVKNINENYFECVHSNSFKAYFDFPHQSQAKSKQYLSEL